MATRPKKDAGQDVPSPAAEAEAKPTAEAKATEAKPAALKKPAAPRAPRAPKAAEPNAAAPAVPARDGNGAAPAAEPPRLKQKYLKDILPALQQQFGYDNVMQVPRVSKVMLNIGLGEALTDANALDRASDDVGTISGQKPVITRARRSIANFRLRQGNPIGVMCTLRGSRMYEFLDRLITAALPRVRDFQGLNPNAFDGRGNYSLGLREQLIFPEIEYDKVDKVRGLQVTIVTSARTDAEGKRLLELMGMPFRRN